MSAPPMTVSTQIPERSVDRTSPQRMRAAQYVRMSTEHQRYSTKNQADIIAAYALCRDIDIIRTYSDAGKSGLSVDRRDELKRLISDVQSGQCDFDIILVYDVSRWGRFQDADESAYYEYLCRKAGIGVEYCAEQFENDGSPISTIVKGVKRAMAGEYSRELSVKVFKGQLNVAGLGYHPGGQACYGLRRRIVDASGKPGRILERGQRKSVQTDRIILVPGPPHEVAVLNWIFRSYVGGMRELHIARELNARNIPSPSGKRWQYSNIHAMLANEKYIGTLVWNRSTQKLKQKSRRNDPAAWVRTAGAFAAIVDGELFAAAQSRLRNQPSADQVMLDALARLLKKRGKLSTDIINDAEGVSWTRTYICRFGGLRKVYELIGYTPSGNFRTREGISFHRQIRAPAIAALVSGIERVGGTAVAQPNGLVRINDEFFAAVAVARYRRKSSYPCWELRYEPQHAPDIVVALRLDETDATVSDYYIFPRRVHQAAHTTIGPQNAEELRPYRFDDLGPLVAISRRCALPGLA
jgi:DNA invertase Pin-like site-specific DNA recombinase